MNFVRRSLFVFLLLAFVLVACGDATPQVTGATLGTMVTAGKITDPKSTFAPTDRMIQLIVTVDNALTNTTVGAKWYQLGNTNRLLFESDVALDAFNTTAEFALTGAQDWTVGNYQVVVYLEGKKERTLDFVVK